MPQVINTSFCFEPQDTARNFPTRGQCAGARGQKVRGHKGGGACARTEDHPVSFRGQTTRHGGPEKQVKNHNNYFFYNKKMVISHNIMLQRHMRVQGLAEKHFCINLLQ